MKLFWKVVGASIVGSIVANQTINTVSKYRRSRLEDEDYQLELKRKREEKELKKLKKKEKQ